MTNYVQVDYPWPEIALVRIIRPDAKNALNDAVREQLTAAFQTVDLNTDVRCAVLTGSGAVFVAGADIKSLAEMTSTEMRRSNAAEVWAALRKFSKPLIAAVNGLALGGGCELAMHADIVIAGESARFGQPEIKVGIIPGAGGTQRLTRAVGKFKAMRMLLTGDPLSARDADTIGLVSEVVPDAVVLERALQIAETIAARPPIAARQIKKLVLAASELPISEALLQEREAFVSMFDTRDQKEGMRAFIEKRPAVFSGE
ncbi:enoyl-CoA hydratase/isomerase family protein [Ensifer sp. ENS04]|uniref:enoyl-CoA hydratase-related protein n=1 Tax=Ensifer sp. ENS04 TaxID=2769281 RepID=UPI001785923E|nr:enoyl-CoA hydratase-related protein [Ensifer sp. ENS04]MBD9541490.1 enoyl-CoA hydratase/isomerase family protein [Ensifer sp. ENS04]